MNSNMYFLQHFSHKGKEKICNDVRKGSRETDRCVEDETNSYSPHLSWDLDENCTHSGVNGREVGDSRAWVFSSICNTGFKQKWKRGKTSDLSTLLFTRGFNEGPLCRLKYTQWKVCRKQNRVTKRRQRQKEVWEQLGQELMFHHQSNLLRNIEITRWRSVSRVVRRGRAEKHSCLWGAEGVFTHILQVNL